MMFRKKVYHSTALEAVRACMMKILVPLGSGIHTTTDLSREEYRLTLVILRPRGIFQAAFLLAFGSSISGIT